MRLKRWVLQDVDSFCLLLSFTTRYLHRLPKRDSSVDQTNDSGDIKEKAHSASIPTEKSAHQCEPVFQEKQQLVDLADEHTTNENTSEHMVTEKAAHHHHDVQNSNNTDTQESGHYETTAPTPQPAQLDTNVTADEQPVPEPATNDDDDDEEVVVTITERSSPEQSGTVATSTAEPAQSAEAVATEDGESKRSESTATPTEGETPKTEEESNTRIPSEQPVEKTPDLAKIDTTETSTPSPPPHQQQRRPQAMAARMFPGIHGRGSIGGGMGGGRGRERLGHDGFPRNSGISLQDVQAQAQQGSSLYREEKEKKEKEEKEAETDERMSMSNESLNVQVLDDDNDSEDESFSNEKKGGVKGERGRRRTKEEMDNEFHEIVVEGMIRNMSLGSSIFPL